MVISFQSSCYPVESPDFWDWGFDLVGFGHIPSLLLSLASCLGLGCYAGEGKCFPEIICPVERKPHLSICRHGLRKLKASSGKQVKPSPSRVEVADPQLLGPVELIIMASPLPFWTPQASVEPFSTQRIWISGYVLL